MAYNVDDLFGGDNLLGDPNDLDNLVEFGHDGNNSDTERQDGDGGRSENGDSGDESKRDGDKKPEEKKIARIRRPQPKLDAERLKGPRGLKELKKSFKDMKFYGKGHEAEDLQRVMSRLEHWSHRLFPKLQFDDFLEKLEKLGSKKVVQNYIKRLRMGLEDEDDIIISRQDDEEAVDNPDPLADDTMGEFDRLLAEQVSLHENSRLAAASNLASPRTPAPATPVPRVPATTSTPVPSLTAEQRARIEANRLAAMERRRTRAALRASGQEPDPPQTAPAPQPDPQ